MCKLKFCENLVLNTRVKVQHFTDYIGTPVGYMDSNSTQSGAY